MEQLANKLTETLVLYQIIKEEDKELYAYGFWQGIILSFNFMTMIAISCLFQMLWQGIVFTIAYGFLRSYAGGYHCRTQTRCYIFSVALICVVLGLMKFVPWNNMGIAVSVILSGIVIFVLAPLEDENKPLDKKEQSVFKKRTHIVLLILTALLLLANVTGLFPVSVCLTITICISAFMLLLEKIKSIAPYAFCTLIRFLHSFRLHFPAGFQRRT
jgi:accessory gene regulator B